MANTKITSRVLADDAVLTANITDANVTTAKIAADAITGAKIADDAINSEHYTDGSIDTAHIADANVTTAKIADDAITTAKIADDVALGGNPTTTTQSAGNNTTRIATTAFVTTALSSISSDSLSDADSDTKIQVEESSDEDKIRFDTGGTERVIIDSTGVGIGTSSPSYKLTINSADEDHLRLENGSELGIIRLTDDGILDLWAHGSDEITFRNGTGTGTETMRIDSSGNVGIGTASPATTLHLDASGGAVMRLQRTSSNASNKLELSHDGTDGTITSTNDLILSATNVGIGTTSPASLLHLDGTTSNTYLTVEANSGASNAIKFVGANTWTLGNDTAAGVGDNNFALLDGSDVRITVDASGNVGIGTTSFISDAVLTVDGGDMMVHGANNSAGVSDLLSGYTRGDYGVFYSSANTIYFRIASSYVSYIASNGTYNVSDERLKENVATLTGTLDKVKQLRGVSHTWKDTEEKGTDTVIGMIAQEVETVYPELVGDGGLPNDNAGNAPYKSINYAHLTSVLVEAVKELSTKLEAAEARIKTLEDA